jgi:pilus assembly protein CpaC
MKTHLTLRHGALGSALAAALALGMAANPAAPAAAYPHRPHAAPHRSAPMAEAPSSGAITLSLGAGQLIVLPRAVSDVFVADDKIADVSPRTATKLYVFGKTAGQTTISATDKSGAVVYTASIRVGTNLANVGQMLKIAMPEAQITATPMSGMMILTGTVATPDDVEQASHLVQAFVGKDTMVVSRIKTATPLQVMLKVRFAEVNRDIAKSIGFNFSTSDSTGGFKFGASQGTVSGLPGGSPLSLLNAATTGSTFNLAGKLLGVDVLSALDLAETDGYSTTLAQPTLTAISGETASFLAGGEIPIPVPQYQGVTTIEYKQYGVSLAFTPTVLGDGRISLRVRPEVSQLTSSTVSIGGYSIPGLTTRRAETTVELGSGQSFVIGGLLNNNLTNSVDKTPFLGDLPVIGQLFRSNQFKRSESELMIVVTPYLVKPVSDRRIAMPTDAYRAPTDTQQVFLGKEVDGASDVRNVKPLAEPPVSATAPGTPVAAMSPADRRRKAKPAADANPGLSIQ